MRKRVAIVYHFFAHYRKAVLEELHWNSSHEFLFVADRKGEAEIREWDPPPDVPFLEAPNHYVGQKIVWQRGVLGLALRRDLDVIIYLGNMAWPTTWVSALLARATGKRVLFWTHGYTRPDRGLKRLVRKAFYRVAHGLLLYGHMAKMVALNEGFAADRLHVIYNSLDYRAQRAARVAIEPDQLRRRRELLFGDATTPVVVCTTRLTRVRRLDQLIEAVARLRADGHQVNVLLVGDGPERLPLGDLASHHGVRVHFFGDCYDEAVLAELIMMSDATVAPGKIGLTAMHSLAFGTPVITHDQWDDQMPEFEAVVPGKTGALFRRGDIDSLAKAIYNWTRPGDRGAVRQACVSIIERFFNPHFQRVAIERAIAGQPADDLFWIKNSSISLQSDAQEIGSNAPVNRK